MFIKIIKIILYFDRMDWGAGHLTIIVGTGGGAFANKNCPQGRAFEQFFQMPGVCRGFARGGCSRLELTRTFLVFVWKFTRFIQNGRICTKMLKLKLIYLNVRLPLCLVRSLRTIRGRLRRITDRSCFPLPALFGVVTVDRQL